MGKTGIQNGNHGFIEKYGIAGILLVIILVFHLLSDSFLTVQNFSNILMNEVVTDRVSGPGRYFYFNSR